MIGAIAKLKIKDGELDGFIEVMRKLVQAVSDNEPGCIYYQMHETSDPQTIMMIEVYEDEAAHANHTQTEHFKTIGMELAPFLAGAPEVTTHKLIS
ncbi:MAG: putative quinol monooxygenase [Pseudomonadota bacterium]|nr:putative quinol monooxygenase [Pseudomonadota bacterium]